MKVKTEMVTVVVGILWNFTELSRGNEYTSGNRRTIDIVTAIVNITYKDPISGEYKSEVDQSGHFGGSSPVEGERGMVVHVRDEKGKNEGCSKPLNVPSEHWIALIRRGDCKFEDKIRNAAITSNASAVVIYNSSHKDIPLMEHEDVKDVVAIAISLSEGEKIAALLENGTKVWMEISVGQKTRREQAHHNNNINKTSVLFVSISFIVLMIISLAWLVFYYIQRFRYAHAKERLSKRLMHAARKAIGKMSSKSLKAGDKETHPEFDPCAVCIENYRSGEVVRTLPCGHIFHKSCVDPWLIEQRSCPMCKSDILKAYGLQIHSSLGSLVNLDLEAASTSIGPSELLPQSSILHSEPGIVEVLYYPDNGADANQSLALAAYEDVASTGGAGNTDDEVRVDRGKEDEVDEETEGAVPEEEQSLLSKEHSRGDGVNPPPAKKRCSAGSQQDDAKASGNKNNTDNEQDESDDVCVGLLEDEVDCNGEDNNHDTVRLGCTGDCGASSDHGSHACECQIGNNDQTENVSGAVVDLKDVKGSRKDDIPRDDDFVQEGVSEDPTQESGQTVRVEGVAGGHSSL